MTSSGAEDDAAPAVAVLELAGGRQEGPGEVLSAGAAARGLADLGGVAGAHALEERDDVGARVGRVEARAGLLPQQIEERGLGALGAAGEKQTDAEQPQRLHALGGGRDGPAPRRPGAPTRRPGPCRRIRTRRALAPARRRRRFGRGARRCRRGGDAGARRCVDRERAGGRRRRSARRARLARVGAASPCGAAGAAFTVVAVTTTASSDSIPAMVRFASRHGVIQKTPADPNSCNEKANFPRAF